MIGTLVLRSLLTLLLCGVFAVSPGQSLADELSQTVALKVEGIESRSDDRDPRVLYILPWQPPSLPKRPRSDLNSEAPALLEPVDPVTLERHRYFRQTLDPNLGPAMSSH